MNGQYAQVQPIRIFLASVVSTPSLALKYAVLIMLL